MKKALFFIIGLLLIAGSLPSFFEKNLGFASPWDSAQSMGYNLAHIIVPLVGIVLFYNGVKMHSKSSK